jgi:putative transposase
VTQALRRYYGGHDLHFITASCYHRRALLGTRARRDVFLRVLENVRCRYGFVVVGYVVMPEHVHLLISEPVRGDPSKVMQVLKQRVARRLLRRKRTSAGQGTLFHADLPVDHFWQRRFYDFNVWSAHKQSEKLRYMHRHPVKRGLVSAPELWAWSSFRWYACAEAGAVKLNEWPTKLKVVRKPVIPTLRKARRVGHPHSGDEQVMNKKGWATRQ